MGTLFEQPVRRTLDVNSVDIENFINQISGYSFSPDHSISISEMIKIVEVLEYRRRTDVMIENGNIFDEQIAGIGELLKSIADSLNDI